MGVSSLAFPGIVGALVLGYMYLYYGEITYTSGAVTAAVVVGLAFFREYANGGFYTGKERITGKTVVITGANTGIGKETAKDLARRGGRIICACRDMTKGEKAVQEVIEETGNNNVVCRKLDLSSFESIREFAKKFNESEDRLDILINNAGIMWCPRMLTKDGYEMQLGTNHFGHFLLTNLLIDKLKSSAPSRIINVSSLGHMTGKINFDDLNAEKSYGRHVCYSQSKLANILHCVELTKRLAGTGVTANSLHPGAVDTELQRHSVNKFLRLILDPLYQMLVKTPVQGAQTTIRLAVDPALETVSGKYFSDCKESKTSAAARDEAVAKRLWEVSEEITKSKYP
ncbi:retinol dehydrogenase-like protein [Plakobranchus ocellatus]|uniref:Retinol dehydrogenase-like protein n=1 Tax=Plakobranchus ocellatus TaxID=259542 RepID=A0AAV4AVU2_9GAST|nr:retinol dehydrogenase-like protein [Plakobranchus ocellatus]